MPIKALLGMIGGITQNIRDKKNKKKQIKQLDEKQKQLDENYLVASNQNYLESGEPKKEVLQLNEQKAAQDSALNNEVTQIGASPEAEITKAAEVNRAYSDAVKKLAKAGSKKKETLKKEYDRKSESIADKKATMGVKKTTLFNQMF